MSNGAKGKPEENEEVSKILAGDRERILNAHEDVPDIRDRMYEPALLDLKTVLHPPRIELSSVNRSFGIQALLSFPKCAREFALGLDQFPGSGPLRLIWIKQQSAHNL